MSRRLEPFPVDMPPAPVVRLNPHSAKRHQSRTKLFVIAGIIIAVAVLGGTGFWFMQHHPKAVPTSRATTAQQTLPSTTVATSSTQIYTSNGTDLNLNLTYPANWSATPVSHSNTTDQPITLTSPISSVSAPSGTTSGKVVVTIRPGSAQVSELSAGNATISQGSTQFAYTKPTSSQHQYPYLTFVHLAGGQNLHNVFDEVIITGVTNFTAGQNLSAASLGQLDPIISARFYACANNSCDSSGQTALAITNDVWQNSTLFQQIQAIFASLQLN